LLAREFPQEDVGCFCHLFDLGLGICGHITCQLRHACFLPMLIGRGCRLSISSGPEGYADGRFQGSIECLSGNLYSIAHLMSKLQSTTLPSFKDCHGLVCDLVSNELLHRARRGTTRRSGAHVAVQCDLRQNRANGRGPGIRGEGQQRVDGQTLKITNWPLAGLSLTYIPKPPSETLLLSNLLISHKLDPQQSCLKASVP
jgi:hypothetical protein